MIVKRRGHQEEYDQKKVYASVYAACLAAHLQDQEAELIAEKVTSEINSWAKEKTEIKSHQIFTKVTQELKSLNKEVHLMYSTHRDLA